MKRVILHRHGVITAFVTLLAVIVFAPGASAQGADGGSLIPGRGRGQEDQPKSVKEFLAKQKAERAKKDHDELLKRGDELSTLTKQIETAFERSSQLAPADGAKLESLEKLVTRIRKSLGGGDDGEDEAEDGPEAVDRSPSTIEEAFAALKERTATLVDEIKKTTRFTISAMAIQSSNSVLKIVRFLRLRK